MEFVKVAHIRVLQGKMELTLSLDKTAPRSTSQSLINRVLKDFPYLADHTCKNEAGPTFGCVMNGTSLPHLFEHMVIDLQAQELLKRGYDQPDVILVGITQWTARENEARVSFSFVNDVIALEAVKKAQELLNLYLAQELITQE
ncbi:MAG: hypothetical protein ACI4BI_05485 [Anaerotardibacter sp.]